MSVQLEFVSAKNLRGKGSEEKLEMIIKRLKKERVIIVLEEPLTAIEQKELIRKTMEEVSGKFSGIEIASLGEDTDTLQGRIIKMLGGKTSGLTVIGPSGVIKEIKRDPEKLRLLAGT